MKLARFWARGADEVSSPDGRRVRAVARGWSNDSLEAARLAARATARRIGERLLGRQDAAGGAYPYGERPLPEPILREFRHDAHPDPRAVVTRNAYGALVLNVRDLMFVDIDRDDAAAAGGAATQLFSGIRSLFGKAAPAPPAPESPVVSGVRRLAEANGVSTRVYKTAAGYRLIVTSVQVDAGSPASERLLGEFGVDPLYARLCRLQQSYRARLTPKPWRCGLSAPPVSFPFDTAQDEARFRTWESEYASTTARYATCRHVTTFGESSLAPDLDALVRYHDQETKAGADLPLA